MVTIVLFHNAATVAVRGLYEKMVPCGPPPKFKEVFADKNAGIIVCKHCAEARGIDASTLIENCRMGGMGDVHKQTSREDCKPAWDRQSISLPLTARRIPRAN